MATKPFQQAVLNVEHIDHQERCFASCGSPWNSLMGQTARYCVQCAIALSPSTVTTDEERVFLLAMKLTPNSDTYEAHYKFTDGTCRKCGRDSVLVYYEIPDS